MDTPWGNRSADGKPWGYRELGPGERRHWVLFWWWNPLTDDISPRALIWFPPFPIPGSWVSLFCSQIWVFGNCLRNERKDKLTQDHWTARQKNLTLDFTLLSCVSHLSSLNLGVLNQRLGQKPRKSHRQTWLSSTGHNTKRETCEKEKPRAEKSCQESRVWVCVFVKQSKNKVTNRMSVCMCETTEEQSYYSKMVQMLWKTRKQFSKNQNGIHQFHFERYSSKNFFFKIYLFYVWECPHGSQKVLTLPRLELQTVVGHRVGAGKRSQDPCKSNQCP